MKKIFLKNIPAKIFFEIILYNAFIMTAALFMFSVNISDAFTEPPLGSDYNTYNTPGPIDISNSQQTKEGAFFVNNEFRATKFADIDDINYYFNPAGDTSLKLKNDLDFTQSGFISNSAWPSDQNDIATKAYVDAAAAAQGW